MRQYDQAYTAANVIYAETFYDANGNVVATSISAANGSYTDTIGGALFQQKTVNADGSYDVRHYTAGSFFGVAYASYDQAYTAANVLIALTYYDGSGKVVASQIIADASDDAAASSGDQSDVILVSFDDPADGVISDVQLAGAAAIADTSADSAGRIVSGVEVVNDGQQTVRAATSLDALMLGADYVSTPSGVELNAAIGPTPTRDTLVRALLVGGIVLPAAIGSFNARAASKQSSQHKRPSLATFDLLADRFEPAEPEVVPFDLPSVVHSGNETVDWEVLS